MTTILVVDDHVSNHRLMDFVLRKQGYDVLVANNGVQALDQLGKAAIDLVITDLLMPKMDGLELLEHMRSDERYRLIPVAMVTASIKARDVERARNAGVTAWITKPIDSEELVGLIGQLLHRELEHGGAVWQSLIPSRF